MMVASDDQQFLARRAVPVRWIIVEPAVVHVQAFNNGEARQGAALDDTTAHDCVLYSRIL